MFLSARNESVELEDIKELIPNLEGIASTSANDMESGRSGGVAGGISTPSASTIPPSDQRAQYHRGKEEPSCSVSGGSGSFFAKYFSVLLLMLVTASLVILPLVLPPLPPPPSMLMLVPVAMLVMLLVLAFMPTSGGRGATGPAPYL
jgi:hypothetical protein